jgi:hypothetical protein
MVLGLKGRVHGSGFRVQKLGFVVKVHGLWVTMKGSGVRGLGLGAGI